MRSLEEVLKDLNEAEKEFKSKCEKYGIEETTKKKSKLVDEEKTNIKDSTNQKEETTI